MLFIANWKMRLSFEETLKFITVNYDELLNLATLPHAEIVLCPSFDSLFAVAMHFEPRYTQTQTNIKIGAQDCSPYTKGNYTGQVAAESLANIKASYCIIGHSERRQYNKETNEEIAEKFTRLIESQISPIICIGETKEEYENGQTLKIIERQLNAVFDKYEHNTQHLPDNLPILIAYEPVWSIGTGLVATPEHLGTVFATLSKYVSQITKGDQFKLLYGGSVNSKTIEFLHKIPEIEGFLIGGASVDFEEFKKIVQFNHLPR